MHLLKRNEVGYGYLIRNLSHESERETVKLSLS